MFLREGRWTADFFHGTVDVLVAEDGLKRVDLSIYDRVVLTGSEISVLDGYPWINKEKELVREIVNKEIPLLGICFGHQLIAAALGGDGKVGHGKEGEFGWYEIEVTEKNSLFSEIQSPFYQYCTHFDEVKKPPPGFITIARSDLCPIEAMAMSEKPVWGIQFHPEISIMQGKGLLFLIKALNPTRKIGVLKALKDPRDSKIAGRLFDNFQSF